MKDGVDSIDKIDIEIIKKLQEQPNISHSKIGRILDRSQPAISSRILKLKRKGIIGTTHGINFKKLKIPLVSVKVIASNPNNLKMKEKKCPFLLNLFSIMGDHNYEFWLMAFSSKTLYTIINRCFLSDCSLKKMNITQIISFEKNFIQEIDSDFFLRNCSSNIDRCNFELTEKTGKCKRIEYIPTYESIQESQELLNKFKKILRNLVDNKPLDLVMVKVLDSYEKLNIVLIEINNNYNDRVDIDFHLFNEKEEVPPQYLDILKERQLLENSEGEANLTHKHFIFKSRFGCEKLNFLSDLKKDSECISLLSYENKFFGTVQFLSSTIDFEGDQELIRNLEDITSFLSKSITFMFLDFLF